MEITDILPKQQKAAVDSVLNGNNVIIKAGAGTGKTYTLVSAIEQDLSHNNGYQYIAAITYTVKATKEIKSRIKKARLDCEKLEICTNYDFIKKEIIFPFFKDTYSDNYPESIISDYSRKISSFEQGIELIKGEGIIGEYNKDIKKSYHYELALSIIQKSLACQRYIKAKYRRIYIDEYQDVSKEAHDFYEYLLKNLNIMLFIVGDTKQTIFGFAGANKDYFDKFWENDSSMFTKFELTHNRRCSDGIQNYANLLFDETLDLITPSKSSNNDVICIITNSNKNWAQIITPYISDESSLALFRLKKIDCINSSLEFKKETGISLVYIPSNPISQFSSIFYNYFFSIGRLVFDNKYNEFCFYPDNLANIVKLNINITAIKYFIEQIKSNVNRKNEERSVNEIFKFGKYLGYFSNDLKYDDVKNILHRLFCELINPDNKYVFLEEKQNKVCQTIHTAKGLAYDHVIIFASDFDEDKKEIHYVSATRARKKLFIIFNPNSDKNYIKLMKSRLKKTNFKSRDLISAQYVTKI